MGNISKKFISFQLVGIAQLVLYLFIYKQGVLLLKNYSQLPLFLFNLCLLFLLYYLSLFLLKKWEGEYKNHVSLLICIIGFGLLYRIINLFLPPILSDDLYYYVWHGKVAAQGLNPYLFTPDSSKLTFLRDSVIWPMIPFKNIPPAYPPYIMSMFWLAFKIGGSSLVKFKLLQFLPELLTFIFGTKLLIQKKINPAWIMIYAWCPLPIIELVGMGHSDAWGVAFLTIFLFYYFKNKMAPAFISLALATLVKWIPFLYLPLLFRKLSWKQRFTACLCYLLVFTLLYLPFLSAGKNVLGLLPTYLKSWEFNGSLYKIIRLGFERADVTHGVVSGFIILWALFVAWKNYSIEKGLLSITLAFFLFFHTVYPWYLCWLLPLLLLETSWAAYAWIFTSFFSYWILINYHKQGLWQENTNTLILEYFPVFFLIIFQSFITKKRRPS